MEMNKMRIPNLPPYAKLFVGIFTTLMVLVCVWAVAIYTVEEGLEEEEDPIGYFTGEESSVGVQAQRSDSDQTTEDTAAVLAPVWDSALAGREIPIDSLKSSDTLLQRLIEVLSEGREEEEHESHLRKNIGLAHTHINGQTLLFFAMGLVFLFTTATPRNKKISLWIFGIAVALHAVGLSGEGYHWFFDDILTLCGVAILTVILYMALRIYVDLGKTGTGDK